MRQWVSRALATKMFTPANSWNFVSPRSEERREHPRYPFNAEILIKTPTLGAALQARTADLSQMGCLVETDFELPLESVVKIRILTMSNSFEAEARVVDCGAGRGLALNFVSVGPEQGATLREWLSMLIEQAPLQGFIARA